jgi:hypothetical protein
VRPRAAIKALDERRAKEIQKRADLHSPELRQLEYDLTKLNALNAKVFAADQDVVMAALKDRLTEERKGFQGKLEVDDLVVRRGKQTTFAPLPCLLVFPPLRYATLYHTIRMI